MSVTASGYTTTDALKGGLTIKTHIFNSDAQVAKKTCGQPRNKLQAVLIRAVLVPLEVKNGASPEPTTPEAP